MLYGCPFEDRVGIQKMKILFSVHNMNIFSGKHEGSNFTSCWPGWLSDGQCLLGTVLPRTRHPTRWYNAYRYRGLYGRLLQHFLLWNQLRETRPPSLVCWLRAKCYRYVVVDMNCFTFDSTSSNFCPLLISISGLSQAGGLEGLYPPHPSCWPNS